MSRRRVILNVHNIIIGLIVTSSLCGMEEHHDEHHEDHHESSFEAAHTSPTQATGVALPASEKLAWQDLRDIEKVSGEGLTTIHEARGNWFFKQQISKDARKLEERINKKVMAIIPLQEKYLNDQAAVDQAFNAFNTEYGFQGGEIDARLEVLLEQIEKLEQTQSVHDPEEVTLLEELKKKKAEVDALKVDFKHLQDFDTALSKGLSDMSSNITKATSYEDQATAHYEAIYDVLNDQVAEELLKKMQVLFDNITAIETYLTGDFNTFFKSTSQKIIDQIEVVKKHIEDLKKDGIALGQKMRELQAKEDEEARLKEQKERERQAKIKETANRTIFSPLFDGINWVLITARDTIGWIFSKIGGVFSWVFGSKAAKIPATEKPEVPQLKPAPKVFAEEPEEEPVQPAVVIPAQGTTTAAVVPAPVVNQPVAPFMPISTAPVVAAAPSSTPVVEPVPTVAAPVVPISAPVDDHPYVPRAVTTEPYIPEVHTEVHPEIHAEGHHEEHHKEHAPELGNA